MNSEALNRARELFDGVVEKPADQRAAILDAACGADRELRSQVERLLRFDAEAGEFMADPTMVPSALAETQSATTSTLEAPGARIGPYKLLEQIGEGGFGLVFMAEQERPIRRQVALKIIKAGMDTKQIIARFEAERQALALMDHPHIARVLDAGATETGRPYFVMELVRGNPLTQYCDDHKLGPRERLELFMDVCQAVQHAHQKGIIHRDLKPSNVLVTVADARPVPKVIDFGVAKALHEKLTDKTLFTGLRQMIGTPTYMSPEQADLGAVDIDTRSDIYALGVLLYELLTGTTPFDAETLRNTSFDELRRILRELSPPPPSTRISALISRSRPSRSSSAADDSRGKSLPDDRLAGDGWSVLEIARHRDTDPVALRRLLHGDLDSIVMKCLSKERERRYETASELGRDISHYLAGEPIEAKRDSALYVLRKTLRRYRRTMLAISLVSASLVLGIIGTGTGLKQARAQRDRAMAAEQQSRRDRDEALAARTAQTQQLWESYLVQAGALHLSPKAGRRFDALAVIAKAAAIRPSLELRNEAIASLALIDLRLVRTLRTGTTASDWFLDRQLERYVINTEHSVSVLRVADDAEVARFSCPERVREQTISLDGQWVLARITPTSDDSASRIRIWAVDGHRPPIDIHDIRAYFFEPDGTLSTVGTSGRNVKFLDPDTGTPRRQFELDFNVRGVRLRPDSRAFAAMSDTEQSVVEIRAIENGQHISSINCPAVVLSLCWSPDGSRLACACYDRVIYVWAVETGKLSATLRGHLNEGFQMAFDPTGEVLASHSWDSTTRIWNLVTGTQEVTAFGQGVQFSPDGTRLGFFQYGDLTAPRGIWELALASERRLLPAGDLGHERIDTAVSPDDRLLACAGTNGILLWDAPSARRLALIPLDRARSVAFAPSGQALYTGSYKGVHEWPMRRNSGRLHIGPPRALYDSGPVRTLSLSGDGRTAVASLWASDQALVFVVDHPQEPRTLGPHRNLAAVAITADGRWAATATHNGFGVRVWDTKSGALVVELPVKTTAWPEWSPDGSMLFVAALDDYTVWRCDTWQEITRGSSSGLLGSKGSRQAATRADPLRGAALRLFDPFSLEVLGDFVLPPGIYGRTRLAGASGWLPAPSQLQSYVALWDLRRVRAELAKLGLDWNAPPISPLPASADDPVDVEVDPGSLGGT